MHIVRIYFTKTGEAAYISHLDLQRVMARALRKSGMPVWWSQGFNPHIYMSFVLPLSLGQESVCEMVDCKTESEENLEKYLEPLSNALPRGINATAIGIPVNNANEMAVAEYRLVYPSGAGDIAAAISGYNTIETAVVTHKTKRSAKPLDLKTLIDKLELSENGGIIIRLPAGSNGNVNPSLLAGFLQDNFALDADRCQITRMNVLNKNGDVFR